MRHKFWKGISALAAIVAGAGAAGAADMAVKAPVYKAPPVILSDWSGFYIGVHGGYGWGHTSFYPQFTLNNPEDFLSTNPRGGLVGGHAGYNWQYGKVVAGVEIDFDGASIKSTDIISSGVSCIIGVGCLPASTSQKLKFDELATARARLGYALLPDLLAYGTAGLAWGHSTLHFKSVSNDILIFDTDSFADHFGWAAGAGLEYHLGHGWLVRGEYLHYDFAKNTYVFPVGGGGDARSTIDTVRGGLSYKF